MRVHRSPEASVGEVEPRAEERGSTTLGDLDAADRVILSALQKAGRVTEQQSAELAESARRGRSVADTVLEHGLASESELARLFAAQAGLPFVDIEATEIDPSSARRIPPATAHRLRALPIGFHDGSPIVAIANPTNKAALAELRALFGDKATFVVADASKLEQRVGALLGSHGGQPSLQGPVRERVQPEQHPSNDESSAPVAAEEETPERHLVPSADAAEVGTEVAPAGPVEAIVPGIDESRGFSVLLRLSNGERLEIGSFPEHGAAIRCADDLVKRLIAGEATGWPIVGERFIRPAAIVSVDVDARPVA